MANYILAYQAGTKQVENNNTYMVEFLRKEEPIDLSLNNLNAYADGGNFESSYWGWGYRESEYVSYNQLGQQYSYSGEHAGLSLIRKTTGYTGEVFNLQPSNFNAEGGKRYIMKAFVYMPNGFPISSNGSAEVYIHLPEGELLTRTPATVTAITDNWVEISSVYYIEHSGNYTPYISIDLSEANSSGQLVTDNFYIFDYDSYLEAVEAAIPDTTRLIELMDSVPIEPRYRANEDETAVIRGSEVSVNVLVKDIEDVRHLIESSYRDFKIHLKKNGTVIWKGWLQPDTITVNDYIKQYKRISFNATDGLGELKEIEFDGVTTERSTIIEIIYECLQYIDLDIQNIEVQLNTYETNFTAPADCALSHFKADRRRFIEVTEGKVKNKDCYTILSEVLKPFNCYILQEDAKYKIINRQEVNSYIHKFSGTTYVDRVPFNRIYFGVDTFLDSGSIAKIPPYKEVNVIFENRNLGENLASPGYRTFNLSTPVTEYSTNQFQVTELTDEDVIRINLDYILHYEDRSDPTARTFLFVHLHNVTTGDKTTQRIRLKDYGSPTHVPIEVNFDVADGTDTYKVSFSIDAGFTAAGSGDWIGGELEGVEMHLNNINIVGVSEDQEDLVTTTNHISTNNSIRESYEKSTEINTYYGDSVNSGDEGALTYVGSETGNSTTWNLFNENNNAPLNELYALQVLRNRSKYKDRLSFNILDQFDELKLSHVLLINNKYYEFISLTKDLKRRSAKGTLQELLTMNTAVSAPTSAFAEYDAVNDNFRLFYEVENNYTYRLEVSLNEGPFTLVYDSLDANPYLDNNTYFNDDETIQTVRYRVRSEYNGNYSSWFYLPKHERKVYTFEAFVSNYSESAIAIEWTSVEDANEYQVIVNDGTTYSYNSAVTVASIEGLEPGSSYEFEVVALLQNGLQLSAYTEATTMEIKKPTSITAAWDASSQRYSVSWNDNSSVETNYRLAVSVNGGNYNHLNGGNISPGTESFIDPTAYNDGDVVRYRIRSEYYTIPSDYVYSPTYTVQLITIPSAPTAVAALFDYDTGKYRVNWNDNSINEDGFRVESSVNGGAWSFEGNVTSGNIYNDSSSIAGGNTIQYRVRAYNAAGNSSYAYSSVYTVPNPIPNAPYLAGATYQAEYNRIQITWNHSGSIEDGFKIYRSSNGGLFSLLTSVGENVFSHYTYSIIDNSSYKYRITAYNESGESDYAETNSVMVSAGGGGGLDPGGDGLDP